MTAWEWLVEDAKSRGDSKVAEALEAFRRELFWAIDEAKWQGERRREIEVENASLRAQLAQAQQDAARYQWIKSAEPGRVEFLLWNWDTLYDTLDDAIDAAIAEGKP